VLLVLIRMNSVGLLTREVSVTDHIVYVCHRSRRSTRHVSVVLVFIRMNSVGFLTREASVTDHMMHVEFFERSRSKSSPLEQTRSKLANPVEFAGFDRG